MKWVPKFLLITPLAAFLLLINGCTVNKRVHNSGYHIEWFSKKGNSPGNPHNIAHNAGTNQNKPAQETRQTQNASQDPAPHQSITTQQPANPKANPPTSSRVSVNKPHPHSNISPLVSGGPQSTYPKPNNPESKTNSPTLLKPFQNKNTQTKQKNIDDEERIFGGKNDKEYDSFAIWGFSLSIAGFIFPLFFIPGLILSIIALSRISKSGKKGRGLAIAGLILSLLAVLFSILLLFLILALF